MRSRSCTLTIAIALVTVAAQSIPTGVPAQVVPTQAVPPKSSAALIDAVTSDPNAAPRLTAQEVATESPESAPPIVGAVVGALPPGQPRLTLAPRVVSAAIAALPAAERVPQAPACACSAIRSVPPSEQGSVVPAIVAAAVALAPGTRLDIVKCATEAVPTMAAAIAAAAGPAPIQAELASPPVSPLPGSTIGRDVLFSNTPQTQGCASPPCP